MLFEIEPEIYKIIDDVNLILLKKLIECVMINKN